MRREFARRNTASADRSGRVSLGLLAVYVCGGSLCWMSTRPATILADSPVLAAGQETSATWAWALLATGVTGGYAVARAFGPIAASAPDHTWLLPTPVDRTAALRPRAFAVLALGSILGLFVGRVAAFVALAPAWGPMTILGGVLGAGVAAAAILIQARLLPTPAGLWLQRVLAGVAAALVGAAAAHRESSIVMNWPMVIGVAVLVAGIAIMAVRSCGRISGAEIASGADVTTGAGASLTALDASLLAGVLRQRAWRRIGTAPTRRLPADRTRAIIRIDLLQHRRRPSTFVFAVAVVAAVWLVTDIGTPILIAFAQLGALLAVTLAFSAGLRDLCADADLRVLLGAPDYVLRLPFLVIPMGAALLATAAIAAVPESEPAALVISLVGAVSAAYRLRTRPSLSYDGLLLETGYGHVPIDLIRQLMRGPDALLVAAVALLAVV
ncbi:ABC transporter permease [Nocardia uniformis]|uniref:ABC transporter permease n=1 Tax=Nocardia uniformis TaxID=53432 RepID=A0A849BXE7_9NOCA|nr:DUF6297 family protein [Nocardia uniformis]NNH68960.1 ABC transporter permease [Nocardia uniformis]